MANISEAYGELVVTCKKEDIETTKEMIIKLNEITSKWHYNIELSDAVEMSDNFEDKSYSDILYTVSGSGRWTFWTNLGWISNENLDKNVKELYKEYNKKLSSPIYFSFAVTDFEPGCEVFCNIYDAFSVGSKDDEEDGEIVKQIASTQTDLDITPENLREHLEYDEYSSIINTPFGYILDEIICSYEDGANFSDDVVNVYNALVKGKNSGDKELVELYKFIDDYKYGDDKESEYFINNKNKLFKIMLEERGKENE